MDGVVRAWTDGFRAHHPRVRFRLRADTRLSAEAFDLLLERSVDIAPFVREPFPAELTRFRGKHGREPLLVPVATGSYATVGGTHALAIYVNAANPLARLTLPQLDAIYSTTRRRGHPRAITTWGDLGLTGEWARQPVHAYGMIHRRATGNPPGIVNYFTQHVLGGGELRADVTQIADLDGVGALDGIVRAVAADRYAIGYAGFANRSDGVEALALAATADGPFHTGTREEVAARTYPLTRTVYLCVAPAAQGGAPPLAREFLRYVLSPEGQAIVAADAAGFLPLPAGMLAAERARLEGATTLRVIADEATGELLARLSTRFGTLQPDTRLDLQMSRPSTALPALTAGISAFAPLARSAWPLEIRPFRQTFGYEPLGIRIARIGYAAPGRAQPPAVYAHASNPLRTLSREQVARIFTTGGESGDFTHWGQVGAGGPWAGRRIHVYGLRDDGTFATGVRHAAMGGLPFAPAYEPLPDAASVISAVGHDPFGIGLSDAVSARDAQSAGARVLHEITGYVHLYVNRAPGAALEPRVGAFARFAVSAQGQAVVATLHNEGQGYAPLTAQEVAAERAKLE